MENCIVYFEYLIWSERDSCKHLCVCSLQIDFSWISEKLKYFEMSYSEDVKDKKII